MSSPTKKVVLWQKAEGAALLLVGILGFFDVQGSWLKLFLLIFLIDISMAGYFKNNVVGAFFYNLGHSLILPILLLVFGYADNHEFMIQLGFVWLAHIGLDRIFGYGLKLDSGFKDTHLGRIN